jgi:PAS domain S-box-containing protein
MIKHLAKVSRYLYFILGIVIIFSVGIVYTVNVSRNEENKIRREMLSLTETYANVLDSENFKNLQQNLSDKEGVDYKIIREKLISIAEVSKPLGIRWIYTMVPVNEQIVFSVDSIDINSPDYSDPGDIYIDASPNFVEKVNNAWENGVPSITKPYNDKWGIFISAIVPIIDKENKKTVSVLASDMDYNLYYVKKINEARRLPIMVTIFLLVSFSYIFFYIISIKKDRQRILDLTVDLSKNKKNILDDDLRMKTIISSMSEGLIIIDKQYKITLINPKALEFFGYKRNEILNKDLRNILKIIKNKKELPLVDWPTEKTLKTNDIVTTSLEENLSITTDKQKNSLAVTFSISPLNTKFETNDQDMGLIIIVRDANKDHELDKIKSGFISIASHQLRAPLTSVRWSSEILLSESAGELNGSQIDLIKEINDGTKRLSKIINILLNISRIENGKILREKKSIDLKIATDDVMKELSPVIDRKNIIIYALSPDIESELIKLDPILIRQVILNILSNAVNYSDNNSSIEIKWILDKEKKEIIYSIKDNGIGIPMVSQGGIFSKFFRASNAMLKVSDGTGLSLAFAKDIINSWGGRIYFETKEGEGTTFFFTIPLPEN